MANYSHMKIIEIPLKTRPNALIMGPAGYKVTDFMRSGGIMTIIFLVVSMVMMNIVF